MKDEEWEALVDAFGPYDGYEVPICVGPQTHHTECKGDPCTCVALYNRDYEVQK